MITESMKLAESILNQIDRHPETHNQKAFGHKDDCGTTHCIAGWALVLTESDDYVWDAAGSMVDASAPNAEITDIPIRAAELLQLSEYNANKLFYLMSNEKAKEALKYIAKGEEIPWTEINSE